LDQIFIEERLYKEIEEVTTYERVVSTVDESLKPYIKRLEQPVTREDIERLLEIRIKRISRYDIERQAKEIRAIRKDIKEIKTSLQDVVGYTINYLEKLLESYGDEFPRLSEITEFSEVKARKVALSNLTVGYNRETGFLGHSIKAENEQNDIVFSCSEYDRLLLIFSSGMYKVVPVPEKLFVGEELEYAAVFEKNVVFNIVYRDGVENLAYVKRFRSPKFILDKEYYLFPPHKRSRILLLLLGEGKHARVSLVPSRRARSNIVEIDFDQFLLKNASAKGKRVSPRVARRVVESTDRVIKERAASSLPGIEPQEDIVAETEVHLDSGSIADTAEQKNKS
jgi:topoisomerase-4 subunit A